MKINLKNLITTVILMTLASVVYAQKVRKTDTIYYLVDTARIPIKDRMVNVGIEIINVASAHRTDTIKYFQINCKCLHNDYRPTFTRHSKFALGPVSKKNINKIKFSSLSSLLEIVIKDYGNDFNSKHTINMVEAVKGKYYKYTVYLTEYNTPTY